MLDTTTETPKVTQIVEKYVMLRDRKAELKAAYDASVKDIDVAMDRVESYLLNTMQEMGVDSFKTPFGTAYQSLKTSASVKDWPSTLAFIQENAEWDMLVRGVSKDFVKAYRDEHNDLPPGINWVELRSVNIRRS